LKYGTRLSIGYKGFAAKRGADYTSKLNLKNRIMNTEKTSLENERQSSCLSDVISHFNSDTFIDNVCLSYRHDFGLIAEQDRQRLRFECKEWMRAISNNWEYFKKATTMKSEAT
jgi:hypothetical protein